MSAELDKVADYWVDDGELCRDCPAYTQEPDINFYGCRVLMGDMPITEAECWRLKDEH